MLINSPFSVFNLTRGMPDRLPLCKGGPAGQPPLDFLAGYELHAPLKSKKRTGVETRISTRETVLSLKFKEEEALSNQNLKNRGGRITLPLHKKEKVAL